MAHYKYAVVGPDNKVISFFTASEQPTVPDGDPNTIHLYEDDAKYKIGDTVDPATGDVTAPASPVLVIQNEVPQYVLNRQAAYPSTEDQLDMLWHAMDAFDMPRIEPFYGTIKAIKAANPKTPTIGTSGSLVL